MAGCCLEPRPIRQSDAVQHVGPLRWVGLGVGGREALPVPRDDLHRRPNLADGHSAPVSQEHRGVVGEATLAPQHHGDDGRGHGRNHRPSLVALRLVRTPQHRARQRVGALHLLEPLEVTRLLGGEALE